MEALGRNPACIIPAWREFLLQGGPLVGIGEPVWPGRSEAELAECRRHESLLNLAFEGGSGWRLLCPYDTQALDAAELAHARHNHPHVCEHGTSHPSADYTETADLLAADGTLPPPATRPAVLAFTPDDLTLLREFVSERAGQAGLDRARVADLVLAVHELATNAIRHGGGHGVVRVWEDDGDPARRRHRPRAHRGPARRPRVPARPRRRRPRPVPREPPLRPRPAALDAGRERGPPAHVRVDIRPVPGTRQAAPRWKTRTT